MAATSWEMQLRAAAKSKKKERKFEIHRPKRRFRRPPWDDTSSDLSVYKPTTAELERRHQLHKPKPLSERKYLQQFQDLLLQENKENVVSRKTFYKSHIEQQKALIKEVFSNQEMELSNVLAETDRTMASVKDLFGDDPMKFKAIPHITDAPNSTCKLNGSLLAIDVQTPSRLNALSDSVMRHPAINDVTYDDRKHESDNSDGFESDDCGRGFANNGNSYHSNFDFEYYNKLLQRERDKDENFYKTRASTGSSSNEKSLKCNREDTRQGYPLKTEEEEEEKEEEEEEEEGHSEIIKTITASKKVERPEVLDRVSEEGDTLAGRIKPLRTTKDSLHKFDEMKEEIDMLVSQQENSSASISIHPLIQLVRELLSQMKLERRLTEHLAEEFQEQRALIDALTGDLINSQEENEKLRSEFDRFKTEIRNEISRMVFKLTKRAILLYERDAEKKQRTDL